MRATDAFFREFPARWTGACIFHITTESFWRGGPGANGPEQLGPTVHNRGPHFGRGGTRECVNVGNRSVGLVMLFWVALASEDLA